MRSGDSEYKELGALMAASLTSYFVSIGWQVAAAEDRFQRKPQDARKRGQTSVPPATRKSRTQPTVFEISGYYSEYQKNIRLDAYAKSFLTGKVVSGISKTFQIRRLIDTVVLLGEEFEAEIGKLIASPATLLRPKKTVLCFELEEYERNQTEKTGSGLQWLQLEVPRYLSSRLGDIETIEIVAPAETDQICERYRGQFLQSDKKFQFDVFIAGSLRVQEPDRLTISSNIISVEGFAPLGPIEVDGRLQDIFSLLESYAASLKEVLSLSIDPDGDWNTEFAFMDRLPPAELLERADGLMRQGSTEGAKLLYNTVLRKDRQSLHAYLQLAEIGERQGRLDEAVQYLKTAIGIDPQNAAANLKLGDLRFNQNDYGAAQQAYEKAKPAAKAYEKLGDLYLFQGRYVDAVNEYQDGLQLHRQHIDLQYSIALAYNTHGEREKAIELLKAVLDREPTHAKAAKLLAKALLDEAAHTNRSAVELEDSRPQEAMRLYSKAIGFIRSSLQYEESGSAFSILGWSYFGLDDYASALEACKKAIELDSELPWPHFGVARIHLAQGRYGSAIDAFNDSLKLNPQNSLALIYQAEAHWKIGENSKAIELLDEAWRISEGKNRWRHARGAMDLAVKIEPQNVDFLIRAAEGHRLTGDRQGALELLQRAIEIGPARSEAFSSRGWVYLDMGQTDKAIADLNRALEIDPNNADGYTTLGKIYFQKSELFTAIDFLDRALISDNQNLEAHRLLARIYHRLDDLDTAIEHFQQALDLDPVNPQLYVELGETYWRNNDINKAVLSLQRAIQLDLSAVRAYFHLGRIYHDDCYENECFNYDRAEAYFAEANKRRNQLENREERLSYQGFYAESLLTNLKSAEALTHIEEVLEKTNHPSTRKDMLLLQTLALLLRDREAEAKQSLLEFRKSRNASKTPDSSRSYAGLRNFVLNEVKGLSKADRDLITKLIQEQEN